jgi:(heptosyl)LPS beta-1,4-glucosyltransferase
MTKLSAVILTKNEESYIAECIGSLRWADGVMVFDSGSTDRTVEIAREMGATVVFHPFRDFASQRNAALDAVEADWVFFVDADERATPELAREAQEAIQDSARVGWWVPRYNYICGRLILGAGCYPDYQLRLLRKGKARYDPRQKVHEKVILDGEAGYLQNPLIHVNCESWSDFTEHQERWARYKAEMLFDRGFKPTYHLVAGPLVEFLRRFIFLQGYKWGCHGLILSGIFAYYVFKMYVHTWELWQVDRQRPAEKQ